MLNESYRLWKASIGFAFPYDALSVKKTYRVGFASLFDLELVDGMEY